MPPEVIDQPAPAAAPPSEPSYQPPPEPAAPEPPAEPAAPAEPVEPVAAKVTLPKSITPPTKTGKFNERFTTLVHEREAAKREAAELRDEVARLRAMTPKEQTHEVQRLERAQAGKVLNPEDFETYGEYVTALVKAETQRHDDEREQRQRQTAQERYVEERKALFHKHAAPLAEKYGEGFMDAISDITLPISDVMSDTILDLDEMAPYMMLYFAAHRNEADTIHNMPPRKAVMAIGRLAERLEREIRDGDTAGGAQSGTPLSESTGGSTATGGAPLPRPTPVQIPRGSAPALNTSPSDKDSIDDWARKEVARIRSVNPNAKFYIPPLR